MKPYDSPLFSLPLSKYLLRFEALDTSKLFGLEAKLRGQLGLLLKGRFCPFTDYRHRKCQNCPHAAICLYPILFAPLSLCIDHKCLGNTKCPDPPPRPFTLSIFGPNSQGLLYPGDQGVVELTLIGPRAIDFRRPLLESLWLAFESLFDQERRKSEIDLQPLDWDALFPAEIEDSWSLQSEQVFLDSDGAPVDPDSLKLAHWIRALNEPDLKPTDHGASRLILEFISPVQSKKIKDCSFVELVRAITGRLKDLKRVYSKDNDMRVFIPDLLKQAEQIQTVEKNIITSRDKCYSHRQSKNIYLDGLLGRICYQGWIEPFIPVLKAGSLIGVGNKLSYGLGRISMSQHF